MSPRWDLQHHPIPHWPFWSLCIAAQAVWLGLGCHFPLYMSILTLSIEVSFFEAFISVLCPLLFWVISPSSSPSFVFLFFRSFHPSFSYCFTKIPWWVSFPKGLLASPQPVKAILIPKTYVKPDQHCPFLYKRWIEIILWALFSWIVWMLTKNFLCHAPL